MTLKRRAPVSSDCGVGLEKKTTTSVYFDDGGIIEAFLPHQITAKKPKQNQSISSVTTLVSSAFGWTHVDITDVPQGKRTLYNATPPSNRIYFHDWPYWPYSVSSGVAGLFFFFFFLVSVTANAGWRFATVRQSLQAGSFWNNSAIEMSLKSFPRPSHHGFAAECFRLHSRLMNIAENVFA